MRLGSVAPRAATHAIVDRHEDQYVVWGYQNVDTVIWTNQPTAEGVERFHTLIPRRLKQTGANRMSVVHLGLEPAKLPGNAARTAFADVGRRWRGHMGALAIVVEQSGFIGSTLRGLATGVLVLSGQRFTTRIASHMGEVAAWLPEPHLRETGVSLDPAELYDVLTEIRSQAGISHGSERRVTSSE